MKGRIIKFRRVSAAITTGLLLLAPQALKASETSTPPLPGPLTLEGAITEGLKRSPEVQKAEASLNERRWRRFEVLGSGFLPRLTLSGTHYFTQQYINSTISFSGNNLAFPGMYPADQLSIDAMIPIFNGLASIRQLEAATLVQDALERELNRTEFQTQEDIRLAFYQALAAAQLEEVASQNVKTMEDHLHQINARKQGGVATSYDSLRVEVQLSEARADAIDAKDNVVLTRAKLTQLLGLEHDDRPLQGELPVPNPSQVKNLELSEVPAERSDIQALNLRAEASEKLYRAQNAWLVPSISLGGQYLLYNAQIYNTAVVNSGNFQSAYHIGVFLKWNLFDGGVALAQANEAAYQRIQAEKTHEAAKLQVPYDFAYWKRRYISNSDHYISKQLDITRSQESVRLSKAEERAGSRTSTEVLDAELDLFRARAGMVNAQVNAAEAQVRLELALGRRI